MEQGFEDLVHHAEVVMALVLAFHVHEVAVQRVEALGEETGDVEGDLGGRSEEEERVLDAGERRGREGSDGGSAGGVEEGGHLPEDRAWCGDARHLDVIAEDLDGSGDEDEERRRGLALGHEDGVGRDGMPWMTGDVIKDGPHGVKRGEGGVRGANGKGVKGCWGW